jgi:ribosomal protein S18 acetylase RimI-like enzyme
MRPVDNTSETGHPLLVRRARPQEHEAIGELVVAAYVDGGSLDGDAGYAAHLRDVAGRADLHPVLVAERDGVLVGTVTLTPHGTPHSHDAREGELEFRYLGVSRTAWGTGVAEALVSACQAYAVDAGASSLVLSVITSNEPAKRLYSRLGFTPDPSRDREPAPGVHLTFWSRPVG